MTRATDSPGPVRAGARAELHELRNSDIPELQRVLMAPGVRESWRCRGEYWSPAQVQGRLAEDAALALVVRPRGASAVAGVAEALDLSLVDRRAHLSLAVHPRWQSTGLAVEAGLLCASVVFDRFAVEKISAGVLSDTWRAVAGLRRHVHHEGTYRRQLHIGDRWHDVEMFALFRDELRPLAARLGLDLPPAAP